MKPRDVASFSIGLVAASLGTFIGEEVNLWQGWTEAFVIVAITLSFGFSFRFVLGRSEGRSLSFATALLWLATSFASAVSFALIVSTAQFGFVALAAGAVFGAFVGVLVGLPLVPIALALRVREPLVDGFDRVLGRGASFVGLASGLLAIHQSGTGKSYSGFAIVGISTVMFLVVALKTRMRARWLDAVLAGEVPSWSVIDRFSGDEQLPAIGVLLKEPAVLASGTFTGGPFRGSAALTPVARIDRAGGYHLRPVLAFACALAMLAVTPLGFYRHQLIVSHLPFEATGKVRHFSGLGPLDDIAVGTNVVCTRSADTWWCWGSSAGYLVPGGWPSMRRPTASRALAGRAVRLGDDEACMLHGGATPCLFPSNVAGVRYEGAVDVAFGKDFQLFLGADGKVTRYGSDAEVLALPPARAIAAQGEASCVLTRDGSVFCNGLGTANLERVHGFGDRPVDRIVARDDDVWGRVTMPDGSRHWYASINGGDALPRPEWDDAEELLANERMECGRSADGAVRCGTEPMLPPGSALQLAASQSTMCARGKNDVWCWGAL